MPRFALLGFNGFIKTTLTVSPYLKHLSDSMEVTMPDA